MGKGLDFLDLLFWSKKWFMDFAIVV